MRKFSHFCFDTCIYDRAKYNFQSTHFAAFRKLYTPKSIKLIIPHPIAIETARHIRDIAETSALALQKTLKDYPSLKQIPTLPELNSYNTEDTIREIASFHDKSFREFIEAYEGIEIDYSGIDIAEIMNLYQNQAAPFGKGKKNKEFPDAFIIASLRNYAKINGCKIAVISDDSDIQAACDSGRYLTCFNSISNFVDDSLRTNERAKLIKAWVPECDWLDDAIKSKFNELPIAFNNGCYVYHASLSAFKVFHEDLDILDVSENYFDISFSVVVFFSGKAQIDHHVGHYGYDFAMAWPEDVEWDSERFELTGNARINVDSDWLETTGVDVLELDQNCITI